MPHRADDAVCGDLGACQPCGPQARVQRHRAPANLQTHGKAPALVRAAGSTTRQAAHASSDLGWHEQVPACRAAASCSRQQQLRAAAPAVPPHLQHSGLDHVPLVHVPRQAHVVHAQHRQLALRNNQGSRWWWASGECHMQGRAAAHSSKLAGWASESIAAEPTGTLSAMLLGCTER